MYEGAPVDTDYMSEQRLEKQLTEAAPLTATDSWWENEGR